MAKKARMGQVLKPAYYDRFSCIGGACEVNCCEDSWQIAIDKNTYMKYRKAKNKEFAETVPSSIRRVKGERSSDQNYATVVRKENGGCVYQTEEGWCRIHMLLGPDYLCLTCKIYPRCASQILPNFLELSTMMSCPEAIRLALLPEQPITFELSETMDLETLSEMKSKILLQPVAPPQGMEVRSFGLQAWSVRESCIDILQDRRYNLIERIMTVGMLTKKISEPEFLASPAAIAKSFAEQAKEGNFVGVCEQMPVNPVLRKPMEKYIMEYIALNARNQRDKANTPYSKLYYNMLDEKVKDVETPEVNDKGRVELRPSTFIESRLDLFRDFMKEKSHIIENYLVNFVFGQLFPYTKEGHTPYEHFVMLVDQYVLLRTLLCGAADLQEGITEQHIISCIVAVSRRYEHNANIAMQMAARYKEEGLDSLAHMLILLRD